MPGSCSPLCVALFLAVLLSLAMDPSPLHVAAAAKHKLTLPVMPGAWSGRKRPQEEAEKEEKDKGSGFMEELSLGRPQRKRAKPCCGKRVQWALSVVCLLAVTLGPSEHRSHSADMREAPLPRRPFLSSWAEGTP